MKKCPKCNKTYDDSWSVCLNCRDTKLTTAEGQIFQKTVQHPPMSKQSKEFTRSLPQRIRSGVVSALITLTMLAIAVAIIFSNEHSRNAVLLIHESKTGSPGILMIIIGLAIATFEGLVWFIKQIWPVLLIIASMFWISSLIKNAVKEGVIEALEHLDLKRDD